MAYKDAGNNENFILYPHMSLALFKFIVKTKLITINHF